MGGTEAGSITVSFSMNENEYRQCAAVLKRRQPKSGNWIAFLAVFFAAIPAALMFRFLSGLSDGPAISAEVGMASLFAYTLGAYAMLTAAFAIQRRSSKRILAATISVYGTRTTVLDLAGVALIRGAGEVRWNWPAIEEFSRERGLLLLWVGPSSAITIPVRCFENNSACEAAETFIRARLAEARPASSA